MVAGLQKPNFKARISSTGRATTSATLSNTKRSSGFSQAKSASAVSYGIRAQRTTAGTGLVFNPSQYNSDYISKQRHAFNDNRPLVNYTYQPHVCKNDNSSNSMNKFAAAMMALNMFQQMGLQTAAKVNEARSAKLDNTNNNTNNNVSSTIGSQIKNADTFASINTVEANIKTSLKSFNDSYKTIDDDNINTIKSTLNSFDEVLGEDGARITLDFDSLAVSDLNISEDSNLNAIGDALTTIDSDLTKVDDFMKEGGQLSIALTKLDSYINETLTSSISKLAASESNGSITPEQKTLLANLRQKKTKAQQARQQLDTTVRNQLKALKTELEGKKSELEKTKKAKADAMDKKYEIAKKLQDDITKTQNDIKTKKAEIDKAKGDKALKLIRDLEALINKLTGYKTDCESISETEIANSKGETVTKPSVEEQYLENPYKNGATHTEESSGGGAVSGNLSPNGLNPNSSSDALNAIQNCKLGKSITIGNATYTKQSDDQFIDSTGRSYTVIQLKNIYRSNANNSLNNIIGNINVDNTN